MQKSNAQILQSIQHDKMSLIPKQLNLLTDQLEPLMILSKTKCLIMLSTSEAIFLDESGPKKQISFKLDPSKNIATILVQEMYVIVIYETTIALYNAATGDFLEEKNKIEKQFKLK